ncbi:MAG: hypothetical protein NVSMB9_28740 [Isosphaeraceae bacterium]
MSPQERLVARLDRLELENGRLSRETRRLKTALGATIMVFAAVFAAGASLQENSGELRASRLVLLDKFGKTRAELSVDAQGKAAMNFLDKNQKSRLALSTMPGGMPSLEFTDQLGKSRIALGVDSFGPPSLSLADQDGKARFVA